MEPLKNVYSISFIEDLALVIDETTIDFNQDVFINSIFSSEWKNKELKQRMRHITLTLYDQLPKPYSEMIQNVLRIVDRLQKIDAKKQSFEYMFLPEFVELFGLDDIENSINAFEKITQFTSCEFAVRPFIIKHPMRMMKQMLLWAGHPHASVRRLATEGCRPRLPWAMALPSLKKNPDSVLDILDKLKDDPSEYVRRSVANNLNDISKDHPKLVIELAKKWLGKNKLRDKIVKHGCRTLLKSGHPDIMPLFGYYQSKLIKTASLTLSSNKISINNKLTFEFTIENESRKEVKLRLEYGIYFLRKNGSAGRKVFKISERSIAPNSSMGITKSHTFKTITTRTYYPGKHKISIIVNGIEKEIVPFILLK